MAHYYKLNTMEYLLILFLICHLALCHKSRSAVNTTGERLSLNKTNDTSRRTTVPRHRSAMDLILMVNSRLKHRHLNEDAIKRMNITGKNDSATGDAIVEINEGEKTADDLLEGDMVLDANDPDDLQLIKLRKENKDGLVEETTQKRQALRQMKRLWLTRQVPYVIHASIPHHVYHNILRAIHKFNQMSCVQFVQYRGGVRYYVVFTRNDGCYSKIGRNYASPGESQAISIGRSCETVDVILHEMLHAVGFYHEQSRPDREKYVKILWENVDKRYHGQFMQYPHKNIDNLGLGYNYKSIMHYGNRAFGRNGQNSIEAIQNSKLRLGGTAMTQQDIFELNAMYDCRTKTYNSWSSWSSYGPCDDQCYKGRQRYCYGQTPRSCGGKPNAYGIEDSYKKCGANECPVRINGHWGPWGPWEDCNVKCNEGYKSRKRKCNEPEPGNGGLECPKSNHEERICIKPRCTLGKYDADFRNGHLGNKWLNDIFDTPGFDWLVGKGDTTTESTGPSEDHYGDTTGYYLYIDSSGRAKNDNARLVSRVMPPATGQNKTCLKFHYHMYGATIGSLSVAIYPVKMKSNNIFWKSGDQGNTWHSAQVTLESSTQFQLIFQARVAGPAYSDIAMDDIHIDEGSCDCQDFFQNCPAWAKLTEECTKFANFMSKYCKRTCDFCSTT